MKARATSAAWTALLALAAGHGLHDFVASWLLTHLPAAGSELALAGFLGYNAVAFGGQVPAALGLERWGGYRRVALLGVATLPVAALLAAHGAPLPALALALAAVASALYHVAGAALAMRLPVRPGLAVGVFAAPGVLGLALGRVGAGAVPLAAWWLGPLAGLLALGIGTYSYQPEQRPAEVAGDPAAAGLSLRSGLLCLVLALAALRAALWHFTEGELAWAGAGGLAVAGAAAAGKLAGGWWLRRRRVGAQVGGALAGAWLLLAWPQAPVVAALLGVALLQSTVPVLIVLLTGLLRGRAGLANALAMGLTVAVGSFPVWWRPVGLGPLLGAGLAGLAGVLAWHYRRRPAAAS